MNVATCSSAGPASLATCIFCNICLDLLGPSKIDRVSCAVAYAGHRIVISGHMATDADASPAPDAGTNHLGQHTQPPNMKHVAVCINQRFMHNVLVTYSPTMYCSSDSSPGRSTTGKLALFVLPMCSGSLRSLALRVVGRGAATAAAEVDAATGDTAALDCSGCTAAVQLSDARQRMCVRRGTNGRGSMGWGSF